MYAKYKIALAAAFLFTGAAEAHPGAKILTAGGADERTAMTPGVAYEDVNGVHVFRGQKKLAGDDIITTRRIETRIEIKAPIYVRRSFRRLRSQGFYSGDRYPSRQYTQGFYSGRR